MDQNQRNKATALALWAGLDHNPGSVAGLLDQVGTWRGPDPVGTQDAAGIVGGLFEPLRRSMPDLERQVHLFCGGLSSENEDGRGDGASWVAGTGYYTGLAQGNLIGMPIRGRQIRLRWGEFLKFDQAGNVIAAQTIWDFVDLLDQVGHPVLPKPRGESHVWPAPTAYQGRLQEAQSPDVSQATLALGRDFIFGGLNGFDENDLTSMGMDRFFHQNIKWYGPGGIGACLSLSEFQLRHQHPWLIAFPDRKVLHLESLFAEDRLLAASGPRGVLATHGGPYLGEAATGRALEVSGLDFWLRTGEQFTENWVFVDMVHLFRQMGIDLMERI